MCCVGGVVVFVQVLVGGCLVYWLFVKNKIVVLVGGLLNNNDLFLMFGLWAFGN